MLTECTCGKIRKVLLSMKEVSLFDPKSVAVAATTYYPKWYRGRLKSVKHTDKVRGDLALEFVRTAKKLGYQIVVVNGKAPSTFYKELCNIGKINILRRRGKKRSPAKRQAVKAASKLVGVKVIVLSEPEKVSFLTECMQYVINPILENRVDIILPKRNEELFKSTYPDYMYESEAEGNKLYNEILRTNGLINNNSSDYDMFFGPRVFKNDPKIVSLFMRRHNVLSSEYFDVDEWSNALYFPVLLAFKKGLRVQSVTVPFLYPKLQKKNEEADAKEIFLEKRKAQRLGLLVELLRFISFIQKK